MRTFFAIIIGIMALPAFAFTQQQVTEASTLIGLPDKFFGRIQKTFQGLRDQLDRQTAHHLQRIIKQEHKIKRKLAKKDSSAAQQLFGDAGAIYQQLQQVHQSGGTTLYIPYLDTLNTSLRFLQQHPQLWRQIKEEAGQLKVSMGSLQALESRLQQAEDIKKILRERQQYLKRQLQNIGFNKAYKRLHKEVYYYSQQVNEYKEMLKRPDKIERKAISLLSKAKPFQEFMRRNSRLASFFRLPGNDDNLFSGASYAGLQTRAHVGNLIQQQITTGGPHAHQQFQQQIQIAQAELEKLNKQLLNSSSTGEADMPNFKPNNQKTKRFKQRLELGTNFQSQKATNYFPVTTDIGLSLGYKLNDKSVIGIGASYKLGWGRGWDHIRITQQGAGIRSFADWKLKGSFWISGGFEMNYRPSINESAVPSSTGVPMMIEEVWQQSGLMGLSKVVNVRSRFFKKARVQLLWDFLSYAQAPRAQPIIFRVGYNLK